MLVHLSNYYRNSVDNRLNFNGPRINYLYSDLESSGWFWLGLSLFIITLGIMIFLIINDAKESKRISKMKITETKLEQMKIEKSLSILECNYSKLQYIGFLILFIQNIILTIAFLSYGFLMGLINGMILDLVIFILIHIEL